MKFSKVKFEQMPLIGILRGISPEALNELIPRYLAAGLTTLEITMNTSGFSDMLSRAVERYGEQLNIGAGTVCTEKDLHQALDAGAQFIVSPILDESIIKACVKQGLPVFPGALTPSEIHLAWSWGAHMVKVFPADAFGPSYIKGILAPLNGLKLLPTGGISFENMADYHRAGAKGFGLGSLLFDKQLIQEGNWKALERKMEGVVDFYRKLNK